MKRRINNLKFNARRALFTSILRIQPRLLPLFDRLFKGSVAFFVLVLLALWIVRFPAADEVEVHVTVPPPPEISYDFLLTTPFRDLREPATRPTPTPSQASSLHLTP